MTHKWLAGLLYETFKKESPEFIASIEKAVDAGMTVTDIKKLARKVFHDQPTNRGIAITVAEYLFEQKHKN